jgi:hypothetical protein
VAVDARAAVVLHLRRAKTLPRLAVRRHHSPLDHQPTLTMCHGWMLCHAFIAAQCVEMKPAYICDDILVKCLPVRKYGRSVRMRTRHRLDPSDHGDNQDRIQACW